MYNRLTTPLLLLSILLLSACARTPHVSLHDEKASSSISFSLNKVSIRTASNYKVFINDNDMGRMDQYLTGSSALNLRAGTHDLKLVRSGAIIMEQSIHLARNSHQALTLR